MPPRDLMDSTVAGNTRSKNPLAAASLPATWAIYKLSDAKKAYATRRPPFVQQTGQLNIETARRQVILADKQGHLPEYPRTAEFRAHSWDKNDFFWTLDLEGSRWIVKAYGGGPQGGVTYRKWLGVKEGFSERPVAFSMKQAEKPQRVEVLSEPHNEAETDTTRVVAHVDTPSEEYNDIDMDEVMAAILSDEADNIEPIAGAINNKASSTIEVIDLTERPTSVPKRQLNSLRNSGGECRFELNRSKKGKKRDSDGSGHDSFSVEGTIENDPKRLRVTKTCQPLVKRLERHNNTEALHFNPFQPCRNSTAAQDMVQSMQRASLDPADSYEHTIMDSYDSCIETRGKDNTQHVNAAAIPSASTSQLPRKKEREASHLYSVTPPSQASFLANASAIIVPPSPRPRWLSGRPMGRCRMVAERILADRNRVVRALDQPVTNPVFSSLQDDISPTTFLGDSNYGSRYFMPASIRNE
ncbi:hypothetical protein MMC11_007778 [Xylographa trunciseda]|nr:hypothetical protein [Xylographa trunciseda]